MGENFERGFNRFPSGPNQEKGLEDIRQDTESMAEAKQFFTKMGLAVESDGFVIAEPNDEQISRLKKWHEETTGDLGIIMPTEQDFYRKTLLATSLWRQEKEEANYLLGKGIGIEIALRGRVVGRERRSVEFPISLT